MMQLEQQNGIALATRMTLSIHHRNAAERKRSAEAGVVDEELRLSERAIVAGGAHNKP